MCAVMTAIPGTHLAGIMGRHGRTALLEGLAGRRLRIPWCGRVGDASSSALGLVALHRAHDGAQLLKIKNIAASAGVEGQWGVACRAVLRLKLADVLPEAGLVGNMAARELEDALAAQGVLEGLLAHSALAADEGAVPACAVALDVQNAGHASRGVREVLRAR